MQRSALWFAASLATLALAGCSGHSGSNAGAGDFTLAVADTLVGGRMVLKGAYLLGADGWTEALANGSALAFQGKGGNVTTSGSVPAGDYTQLRLLFASVELGGRKAALTQSGIEVGVNLTVTKGSNSTIGLAFAWPDAFYESDQGLAFTPVLSLLTTATDGVETARLEASQISTNSGKAPVARMRVFDSTGLEVFLSTFVADSPEKPVVGNAGNITFSATASETLQPRTTLAKKAWDITGNGNVTTLQGNTVVWKAPISGGNYTVRLTVADSDGNTDTQTVKMALKPGLQTRTVSFTGQATGAGGTQGVVEHVFPVNATDYDGAPANLTHVLLLLQPGSATVPASDLDVTLDDSAAKRVGAQTGAGSQHKIDVDYAGTASGDWKVRVIPDPAVGASYTVTITLTWKGVNPGMEAFLADYDDGHTHTH